jgi:hypothetical protein
MGADEDICWPESADEVAPRIGSIASGFRELLAADNHLRMPSIMADSGHVGPWWICAASTVGRGHLHSGVTNQDAYGFCLSGDGSGAICAVVADGLGSKPMTAQVGSLLLSRLLARQLAAAVGGDGLSSLLREAPDVLCDVNSDLIDRLNVFFPHNALSDFSCAAAFIVSSVGRDGALVGRVGDCNAYSLLDGNFSRLFDNDLSPLNVVHQTFPHFMVEEPFGAH